jgi:signal transduction histidine kinase
MANEATGFRDSWRIALVVGGLAALGPTITHTPYPALAVLFALVQVVALWWMPRHPSAVLAIVVVGGAGTQYLVHAYGPGICLVVLCTYAWLRPARRSLAGLVFTIVVFGALALVEQRTSDTLLWTVAAVLAWSWGALGRALGERREAERRRAVLEERARIARELHDVLAHTVSVMVVQASAADDIFDVDPAKARVAVRQVEASGREALAELRGFLRAIRPDEGAAEPADAPQPGLADLDRLAASLSNVGLALDVQLDELASEDVPQVVGAAVYRIVQESVTNTIRHAKATNIHVVVRRAGDELCVEVTDDGRGPGRLSGVGTGHGIVNMRERARLLGGTLETGPAPSGGFRVQARLPMEGAR